MTAPLPSVDDVMMQAASTARTTIALVDSKFNSEAVLEEADTEYTKFRTLIEQLHAAAVEGQADKARLDWLFLQDFDDVSLTLLHDCPRDGEYRVSTHKTKGIGATPRAAIDDAIKQENKDGK